MKSPAFVFAFFFLIDQRLLHYSWDMNSANRQINSTFSLNSKFFIIFFIIFSFQQNKWYLNVPLIDLFLLTLWSKSFEFYPHYVNLEPYLQFPGGCNLCILSGIYRKQFAFVNKCTLSLK